MFLDRSANNQTNINNSARADARANTTQQTMVSNARVDARALQDTKETKRPQRPIKTHQDGKKKKRSSGKSRESTSWTRGQRKGRSWAVNWTMLGKKPQLQRGYRYVMVWEGGRNMKLVQVTAASKKDRVTIKREKYN